MCASNKRFHNRETYFCGDLNDSLETLERPDPELCDRGFGQPLDVDYFLVPSPVSNQMRDDAHNYFGESFSLVN